LEIKLTHLFQHHEALMGLMTSMMSEVVHEVNQPGSLHTCLQQLADSITSRYDQQQIIISNDTATAFFLLRELFKFFDQYHAREYHQVLEVSSAT
jgi:hypothetical protein